MHVSATTRERLSVFVFFVASVAALFYSVISLADSAMFYERSERATGTAVSLGHQKTIGVRAKETFTTIVVEFTTITSEKMRIDDVPKIDARNTDVGDTVALRYDPDNPTRVVPDSLPTFLWLNRWPLVAGILGLPMPLLMLMTMMLRLINDM